MKTTCVICSDFFTSDSAIVVTPCGHVFHHHCSLHWLGKSETCPQCRGRCKEKDIKRVYFNVDEESESSVDSEGKLANELSKVKADVRLKDMELKKTQEVASELRKLVIKAENEAVEMKTKYIEGKGSEAAIKLQLKQTLKELSIVNTISTENKHLKNELSHLKNVESILKGSQSEIDEILNSYGGDSKSQRQMATYLAMLKKELSSSIESKQHLQHEVKHLRRELGFLKTEVHEKNSQIERLTKDLQKSQTELEQLHFDGLGEDTNISFNSKGRKSLSMIEENVPTPPCKKPRINMVQTFVKQLKERDQITDFNPKQKNFLRNESVKLDTDSIIREGFNGLGGHSKHVIRSDFLQIRMSKKPQTKKGKQTNGLHKFIH